MTVRDACIKQLIITQKISGQAQDSMADELCEIVKREGISDTPIIELVKELIIQTELPVESAGLAAEILYKAMNLEINIVGSE